MVRSAVLIGLLLLCGCAAQPNKDARYDAVKRKAEESAQALLNGDYATMADLIPK
jgi:hypothetical protein